jgi:hypothetical protein
MAVQIILSCSLVNNKFFFPFAISSLPPKIIKHLESLFMRFQSVLSLLFVYKVFVYLGFDDLGNVL